MVHSLLIDLYDLGDRMVSALESGETDEYFSLLEERGTLVDALMTYPRPSEADPEWEEMARALSRQNEALLDAAEAQQERLRDAVTRLGQVKGAQRAYHQPPARSSILHDNLRV